MSPKDKWSSPFDFDRSKSLSGPTRRSVPPLASSYPANKLVVLNVPKEYPESVEYFEEINDWLIDNKVKYREVEVLVGGSGVQAYLFKNSDRALYFKLAWG